MFLLSMFIHITALFLNQINNIPESNSLFINNHFKIYTELNLVNSSGLWRFSLMGPFCRNKLELLTKKYWWGRAPCLKWAVRSCMFQYTKRKNIYTPSKHRLDTFFCWNNSNSWRYFIGGLKVGIQYVLY